MPMPTSQRVQKRREALRAAGLRPLQIWVPDTRAAGFAVECRRESLELARSDTEDRGLMDFLDVALADLDLPQ